jgi:uncharacterized metal-binding protein YceD (DUF177 family)
MSLSPVHLRDIPESGLDIEPVLSAAWLREALDGTGAEPTADPAGVLHVRLDRSDPDVILNVRGAVRVRATCVRCLEPIEFDVPCTTALLLEPAAKASRAPRPGEEHELSADDLDKDVFHDDKIDLAHWIREQILVELPAHPVHEDCRPPSAAEVEVTRRDPRFAALEKFKK